MQNILLETKKVRVPFEEGVIETLRAGDRLLLTGTIYTARDKAHNLMFQELETTGSFPFDIQGQTIYYMGPSPTKPGAIIGAAGPTTSKRMDAYAPLLFDKGLKATIGKGYRSIEVVEAIKRNKAVYLIAIGGSGTIISETIKQVEIIAYDYLGTEAIRKLEVENMPVIVGIDCLGNNIYEINKDTYKNKKYLKGNEKNE